MYGDRGVVRDPQDGLGRLARILDLAAAEPSPSAKRQRATRRAADGTPLHNFRTLLADLATVTRNVCRTKGETDTRRTEFELDTLLSAEQARPGVAERHPHLTVRPPLVGSRREFRPITSA